MEYNHDDNYDDSDSFENESSSSIRTRELVRTFQREPDTSSADLAIGEEEIADDEPTQPDRSCPGDAVVTFYRAILGVQAKCNELAVALNEGYPLDIEIAASNLASAWFAAAAAIKELHVRTVDAKAQESAAMLALHVSHQALGDLFSRCLAPPSPATKLPRLRDILCHLISRIDHTINCLI